MVIFLAFKDSQFVRELYIVDINGGATIKLSSSVSSGANSSSVNRFAFSANASRAVSSSRHEQQLAVERRHRQPAPVRISGNTVQATGTLGTGFVVSRSAPYPVVFDA